MKFFLLSTILFAGAGGIKGSGTDADELRNTKTTPSAPAVAATATNINSKSSKSSSKSGKSAAHSYKELYDALLLKYEKQTFVVSKLREILLDAQVKLQHLIL